MNKYFIFSIKYQTILFLCNGSTRIKPTRFSFSARKSISSKGFTDSHHHQLAVKFALNYFSSVLLFKIEVILHENKMNVNDKHSFIFNLDSSVAIDEQLQTFQKQSSFQDDTRNQRFCQQRQKTPYAFLAKFLRLNLPLLNGKYHTSSH